jgi:predicted nicotinamide N-methyase
MTGPAATGALESLRSRFDVIESTVQLGTRSVVIAHPRNSDVLISEADYVKDERLPYWADVWPASHALARHVLALPGEGSSLLELGCGAGLSSVAATLAGFRVVATDYYPDALEFTAANVLANTGREIEVREVDWRYFPHDLGRFDYVIASDVLYEKDHAELVARAFDRTLFGRGRGVLADPGRIAAPAFVDACRERRMDVSVMERFPYDDGVRQQTIDLYQIIRLR